MNCRTKKIEQDYAARAVLYDIGSVYEAELQHVLADHVCQDEMERLAGNYNQSSKHGVAYALDGKALRGVRKRDEESAPDLLSVCNVEQVKALSQVDVGHKAFALLTTPFSQP